MPFNGTGTFTRIYNWVTDQANGILVRADRMDTDTDDIATGLSNCITRDGQGTPTATIPWGSQKISNLANGTNPQDATTVLQVFTSPTFTGTVTVASLTGTGTINLTAGTVTVATQAALDNSTKAASTAYSDAAVAVEKARGLAAEALLAPKASPTFTGTVTIPTGASIADYAPLASPAFTGAPTVPTAAAGTNTTQAASTAFVNGVAMAAALPAQGGNASKFVTTDGATASFVSIPAASIYSALNFGGF
jgi:hypothetical protein